MEVSSSKDSSVASSPFSSPNVSALLKIKVISWCQETGLPVSIRVRVGERTFGLHKHPLFSKSGYFQKRLTESNELELPQDFPGGPVTFEMITLLIYGSTTLVDPFNVAALRCAAEFLEMTEEYCTGNLCERFDLYLNQVVLQSWDDTLIVLQKSQALLPWSEELLIVSRCIESLAFMSCMEILDPERRRDKPVVTLEALAGEAWSSGTVKAIASKDLWIKDLIALPYGFFKRIIGSLRRQGMKEKYVTPIIVLYANKWLLSKKTQQFWENSCEETDDCDSDNKGSAILQGILELLPIGEKTGRSIPVGFYFAMLSRSLEFGLTSERLVKLQDQIASMLHFAQVEDFIFPHVRTESISSSKELAIMKNIFSTFASFNMETNPSPSASNSIVAELWDTYLSQIASDPQMGPKKFMELVELLPISYRQTHDQLYRATNSFLQAHRGITQEEKGSVCKYLNCEKLSQEACIEAVQNEFTGQFSGSLSSSRCPNSRTLNLEESPYNDAVESTNSKPLSLFLQDDLPTIERNYESTSFRLQNLEQELMALKKTLEWHEMSKKTDLKPNESQCMKPYGLERRSGSKRKNPLGEVTGCIGSVNFASQRKYASRLIKIFRRLSLFGMRKPKRKTGTSKSI
ncbi:putative serine/threonine-protein kinase WNK11-like [Hibiscus syriacus]|uniref:Serine/threonine-protein kinase WNK11-like n=1 Tax=Hibiscus syriacus TaxID=106335 RepID=A0A6A3CNT4_HIBSY|nr:putative serine/threonine-protein kinase WNK11-like [Hibiscus syriacus]